MTLRSIALCLSLFLQVGYSYLREALIAAENIDTAAIAAKAKEDEKDIAEEIRSARVAALKLFMKTTRSDRST